MEIKYLILSGGGQNFFNYIGIFKELFKKKAINIENIKSIYGTSSGSLIAVMLCLKYEWDIIEKYIIERPWDKDFSLTMDNFINLNKNMGLYSSDFFKTIFKSLLNGKDLSIDLTMKELYNYSDIEIHIYTVELNSFELIDISYKTHPDYKVLDAIRMSSSYPVFIIPLCDSENCYTDGGLILNYPINNCIKDNNLNSDEDKDKILGIKFNNISSVNKINDESSLIDYLRKIISKLSTTIKNDNINDEIIKNEIVIDFQGFSFETMLDSITNKNTRIKLLEEGEQFVISFLDNL